MDQDVKKCCDQCSALQVQIRALEKRITDADNFNRERFASREEATTIAQNAAKDKFDVFKENYQAVLTALGRRVDDTVRMREILQERITLFVPRAEIDKTAEELKNTLIAVRATIVPRSEHLQSLEVQSITNSRITDEIKRVLDICLPRNIYEVQHEQLKHQVDTSVSRLYEIEKGLFNLNQITKQIDINTARLVVIEQQLASLNAAQIAVEKSRSQESQHRQGAISNSYYIFGMAGVLFAVATSVVTVLWNFFHTAGVPLFPAH